VLSLGVGAVTASDLGRRQTSAAQPRPAATADVSSSLSVWLTVASFLDAWIWAWRAWIRVEDFFFKKN
jgi:hypothetical protein